MAYLGQSPFGQTVRTTTSVVATAGQTTVYPTGGYTIGYIDVWVNGAKLAENTDFTANDGLSVVFDPALDLNDQVEILAYGAFALVDAVRRSGDTLSGTLITQNVIPVNNTYSLGNTTNRFSDIYLANSSIYLGDLILSSNATNILLSNSSSLIGTVATGGGIDTFTYTAANATVDVLTTNGASYSITLNTGNSSVAGLLQIVDSTSNVSASIAASANAVKTAYDAAVSAQNMAANAYSNAASYTDTAINDLIGTAPTALNTLNELAAALGNDANFATTVVTGIGTAYSNAVAYADTKANTSFTTIAVSGQTSVVADTASDTLTFANGLGIAISTNADTDTITIAQSSITRQQLTGNGSNTVFTLTGTGTEDNILIFVDGVYFHPNEDYTVSSSTLTFASAPASSAEIRIRYLR